MDGIKGLQFYKVSLNEIQALEVEWNELHERSVAPSFYNQFSYISKIKEEKLRFESFIVLIRFNAQLIGIFNVRYMPELSERSNIVGISISASDEIDKPYPVIHENFHVLAWQGFFQCLNEVKWWDFIQLPEQRESNFNFIKRAITDNKYLLRENSCKSGPIISLEDSWDVFLSKHKKSRKRLIKFERDYGDCSTFRMEYGEVLFEDYLRVEKESWKYLSLGIQRNFKTHNFYNDLIVNNQAGNILIGVLYINKKPVSAELAYIYNDTVYLAQGCYDQKFKNSSPGMISTSLLLKELITRKDLKKADALCGYAGYLDSWAKEIVVTKRYDLYRANMRVCVFFFKRILRKALVKLGIIKLIEKYGE